ncbi:MAG TPA: hypothetical protein VIO12_07090 [Thermoanaerobaculia bacterium]
MRKISLLVVVLLLAACGSSGLGDLGTILGSPSSTQASDVQATVNSVDSQAQRLCRGYDHGHAQRAGLSAKSGEVRSSKCE